MVLNVKTIKKSQYTMILNKLIKSKILSNLNILTITSYLYHQAKLAFFICSNMYFPICAGDSDTTIPASVKAFILLGASPLPSELTNNHFEQ